MESFFGTVDYLNRNIDHKSLLNDKAVRKIAGAGDPVNTLAQDQGAGGVSFAANLQNLNKYKRGSINAFQNALSMMQMQSEGLRQAEKIYNRMLSVAQMASDPSADSQTRGLLAKEFADLREQSIAINAMTVNGKDLFDARAASTQYSVDFGADATEDSTPTGGIKDGIFVPGAVDDGSTDQPYWDVQKDVIYNAGIMTIDFRPFTAWDKIQIYQDDPDKLIFDSGQWQTAWHGRNPDSKYDRFVVRYGPDRETTFTFKDSPENTTGSHTDPSTSNKSYFLSKFNLVDDDSSSGMQKYYNKELTQLGQVKTSNSNDDSTLLTLRVIGKYWNTGYDLRANWEPLDLDDSVVGRTDDMQVKLNQMGLGYLRIDNEDLDFPVISVGTTADALKAIDVLRAEIDNLGEQNGRLGSNYTRVEIAMDAAQKQLMTQEKALSQVGGTDFTADLIELSKTRIERHQNAALMTQAMSIHQDIVNLLI